MTFFMGEEIPAEVLFAEDIGRFHIMVCELVDVFGVTVAGALGEAFQGHVFDEPLSARVS